MENMQLVGKKWLVASRIVAIVFNVLLVICHPSLKGADKPKAKAQRGDKGVEALTYLQAADRDLECKPEGSRVWARKALSTLGGVRTKDKIVRENLARFSGDATAKIAAADRRVTELKVGSARGRELLKMAKLESALSELQRVDAQGCYAGLRDLRDKIGQRRSAASALVREGDAMAATAPRNSLALYNRARVINLEYPQLEDKRASTYGKRNLTK